MSKCRKKYNRLKKIKIMKERKEKKWKRKNKGKLHRTAKSNVEAEVYNNNKKILRKRKAQKLS